MSRFTKNNKKYIYTIHNKTKSNVFIEKNKKNEVNIELIRIGPP